MVGTSDCDVMDAEDVFRQFCDPGMLPVAEQSSWINMPFMARSRKIIENTSIPEWKIHEITNSLMVLFVIFQKEGKSYLLSIAEIDAVIYNLVG